MKFSFIIPVFNEERYIKACIRSIKKQAAEDFEIIVVDNGCRDKTIKIAEKLGVRTIKENKSGISFARNCGALASKGDIYCFIDADGLLSKNWLSEVTKSLSDSRIKAVSGLNIFTAKSFLKKLLYNIYTVIVYGIVVLLSLIFSKTCLVGNNLAIKKELFWKLGGFEPVIGEDYWLSKKFWKLKDKKAKINPQAIIWYSARGFEAKGFLKTIYFWIKQTTKKTTQAGYNYRSFSHRN